MHKFKELETIILKHDIQEHGLNVGDMGAVEFAKKICRATEYSNY